jgi:hypothetical protein
MDNIETSDVFIFMVSEKSVQSPYCLDELGFAVDLNLPVLPLVGLDDHKRYLMPDDIVKGHYQWFVYDKDPARTLERIEEACGKLDWNLYQKRRAIRRPEPNTGADSLIKRFHQAASLAEEGHFREAIQRFREVKRDDHRRWGERCEQWIGRLTLYAEIVEFAESKWTLQDARAGWSEYVKTYGVDFDPMDMKVKLTDAGKVAAPAVIKKPKVVDLMPPPFRWVNIPAGKVTLVDNLRADLKIPIGRIGEAKNANSNQREYQKCRTSKGDMPVI